MKNAIEKTVGAIDVMISNADKGPSGFWVDGREGCGNPRVFPEFVEGIEKGKLIQKEHAICPWNTAVMYGSDCGNINTGCCHSCSIGDAVFLSKEMLQNVLERYKRKLQDGEYENPESIEPLLSEEEKTFIEKAKEKKKKHDAMLNRKKEQYRLKKAAGLLEKYKKDDLYEDLKGLVAAHYGKNVVVQTEKGLLDFSRKGFNRVETHKVPFTYDDYLDLQIQSLYNGEKRVSLEAGYHNVPLEFRGEVALKSTKKQKVLLKDIVCVNMYYDGLLFSGKEEHVWVDLDGFDVFDVGDKVAFYAEIYYYLKTGNGKKLNYGLKSIQGIKRVDDCDFE
ncbi:MAG: hypothetical protein J5441_07635 [Clostridia bacterium]|nr:hypothetical protein [Clostridia bacterium]